MEAIKTATVYPGFIRPLRNRIHGIMRCGSLIEMWKKILSETHWNHNSSAPSIHINIHTGRDGDFDTMPSLSLSFYQEAPFLLLWMQCLLFVLELYSCFHLFIVYYCIFKVYVALFGYSFIY